MCYQFISLLLRWIFTIYDELCILILPIIGGLLDGSPIHRSKVVEMLVEELEIDIEES